MVTVCDACLTAACWHGTFCCGAINPGLTEMSTEELAALDLEHPRNWVICDDCLTACGGKCQSRQSRAVSSRMRGYQ